ncbi:MAG: enoyl-CoA hydratase/isomerase family protein, partial [Magnetospirillum sp.]|nr:enoyl-CoA hydratase/isomerase family protein [Magnetospirillum sp.]
LAAIARICGPAVAAEILLEGRVFDAAEALAKRLLHRVVEDDAVEAEVLATARRIAAGSPVANRSHKRFLARLDDPTPVTAAEMDACYAFLDGDDYREGMAAFREKRKPVFS